jgi:hypothetical protein
MEDKSNNEMRNSVSEKKNSDNTVVRLVNTAVGNSTGQAGTFLSAGSSLLVVYLVSGGAISTCQYGLHLIVKELSTDNSGVVFSPLLNMSVASALKIGLGSVVGVLMGGVLRKVGTGMTSERWITYWEDIFYSK